MNESYFAAYWPNFFLSHRLSLQSSHADKLLGEIRHNKNCNNEKNVFVYNAREKSAAVNTFTISFDKFFYRSHGSHRFMPACREGKRHGKFEMNN